MALRDLLLAAPDGHLDRSLFPLIRGWSTPPSAVQVLEVIDACVHSGLASSFVMESLIAEYDLRRAHEGLSHDDVVARATWR